MKALEEGPLMLRDSGPASGKLRVDGRDSGVFNLGFGIQDLVTEGSRFGLGSCPGVRVKGSGRERSGHMGYGLKSCIAGSRVSGSGCES